jgi:hypothetical protein
MKTSSKVTSVSVATALRLLLLPALVGLIAPSALQAAAVT